MAPSGPAIGREVLLLASREGDVAVRGRDENVRVGRVLRDGGLAVALVGACQVDVRVVSLTPRGEERTRPRLALGKVRVGTHPLKDPYGKERVLVGACGGQGGHLHTQGLAKPARQRGPILCVAGRESQELRLVLPL